MGRDPFDDGQFREFGLGTADVGPPCGARCGAEAWAHGEDRERLKAPERENRELQSADENLDKASAFFAAAELYRVTKRPTP